MHGLVYSEEACIVLAEFSGKAVLADPFVYNVGGVYGVTVLAYEAGTARGLGDLRLAALASAYLCDPHGLGVAKYIEAARRVVGMRDPLWGTL